MRNLMDKQIFASIMYVYWEPYLRHGYNVTEI